MPPRSQKTQWEGGGVAHTKVSARTAGIFKRPRRSDVTLNFPPIPERVNCAIRFRPELQGNMAVEEGAEVAVLVSGSSAFGFDIAFFKPPLWLCRCGVSAPVSHVW